MSARSLTDSRPASLAREVVRFGAVGGAGVLVDFAVFNGVREFTGLPVVRCSMIATLVAIVFNYLGFRYYTYRDRDKRGQSRELLLFVVFSAVGLVIQNGVLYVATYGFDWDSSLQNNVFKGIGILIASAFRFWSYRTWVFRTAPPAQAAPAAEPSSVVIGLPAQAAQEQREYRGELLEQFEPAAVGLREVAGHGQAEPRRVTAADGALEDS
jgi:putative flippase GtrA